MCVCVCVCVWGGGRGEEGGGGEEGAGLVERSQLDGKNVLHLQKPEFTFLAKQFLNSKTITEGIEKRKNIGHRPDHLHLSHPFLLSEIK